MYLNDDRSDCKECFIRGCECECNTCEEVRPRNWRLTNLELTRLSVAKALEESGASEEVKQFTGRMLRGMGL